jgi:hypothetical protein
MSELRCPQAGYRLREKIDVWFSGTENQLA